MDDLYFKNTKELELFLSDKEKLGTGAEGSCFKIGDYSLKIYKELMKNYKSKNSISNYLQFKDLDIPNFNFIKNSVFIKEDEMKYIIGTICKYVEGDALTYNTLYYTPIEDIIFAITNLLPSIKELSKKCIMVEDVFVNNIIYHDKKFNFIDTASYFESYEEPYYTYKNNVITIMTELMMCITNTYKSGLINTHLYKINPGLNYNIDTELLFNPIYLLKELKKSLEEYCEYEIKTFSDCEKKLTKKLIY